jgi:hypothetical protein
MQVTRNAGETAAGPSDWFTGTVYIDTVAVPAAPARGQPRKLGRAGQRRRVQRHAGSLSRATPALLRCFGGGYLPVGVNTTWKLLL